MAKAIIKDVRFEKPITYWIDDRMKKNLDDKVIPSLHKKDKDYVICIDGGEGTGKSTLAFQIGKYVDPSLNLSRIVFSPEEFRQAVFKAKKGECIIYDEAFTGFSSRSALSGINRALVSLAMQFRQKNLFVIIVLPTIFLLDKYLAMFRTKILIHVYENHGNRGYFRVYPKKLKKYLILMGQKTYSYKVRTNFKGRFYGNFALGDDKEEEKYRKVKGKALEDSEKNPMSAGQAKYMEQRNLLIHILRKETKLTYRKLEEYLNTYDLPLTYQQIAKICSSFGDKQEKEKEIVEKVPKMEEIDEIEDESDDFDEEVMVNDGNIEKSEGV
jgi:hypothetical protein